MSLEFSCPKCNVSLGVHNKNVSHLYEHINECCRRLNCTNCSDKQFTKESDLLEHFIDEHSESLTSKQPCPVCRKHYEQEEQDKPDSIPRKKGKAKDRLPTKGDRVLAMCKEHQWEYLPAIIKRYHKGSMKYEVKWTGDLSDDGLIDIADIAIDRNPDGKELGMGTLILFRQGEYDTKQKGIKRWHKGIITQVLQTSNGNRSYHGHHTKDEKDGKLTTYKRYSYEFRNLTKYDLRLEPNVFDVIQSIKKPSKANAPDIFLSFDLTDSHRAVKNDLVINDEVPHSYKTTGYENMCDPYDIKDFLEKEGLNVVAPRLGKNPDLKDICSMIKNSTIFIGCLSDQYVSNKQCCMEFQYAKTSLRKPVIPLVVGNESYDWISSVIGMLIAGELFIHFRNKDVAVAKNAELLTAIRHHIPDKVNLGQQIGGLKLPKDSATDIFISYCWWNSLLAENAKQIAKANGFKFNDPRLLKSKLTERGYTVWLDTERLEPANSDAGLFGQIAKALKKTKIFLPCISVEYSISNNCKMEFQFALKSLRKPVIPVVVGNKEDWKTSVKGALLSTQENDPIDLHNIKTEGELDRKVEEIIEYVNEIESRPIFEQSKTTTNRFCRSWATARRRSGSSSDSENSSESNTDEEYFYSAGVANNTQSYQTYKRAPEIGDEVVSHYDQSFYSFGTVVGLDVDTMTYSLNLDYHEQSHCVKPFDFVAINAPPDANDITIGSTVFFPQGTHFCSITNKRKLSYHKGEVTAINCKDMDNVKMSGRHTDSDIGEVYFEDVSITSIRLPPTALDFIFVATF